MDSIITWVCDECGEEGNTEDACISCGNEQPWTCTNCQNINKGYRLTCAHCLEGKP